MTPIVELKSVAKTYHTPVERLKHWRILVLRLIKESLSV